jgi:hypothetical protein
MYVGVISLENVMYRRKKERKKTTDQFFFIGFN